MAKASPAIDLDFVESARQSGKTWTAIAAQLGIPEATVRGRMIRAGRIASTRRARTATSATSAPPAHTAPATNPAPAGFIPPAWYPLLRYAVQAEKGATLFGPRGCGKSTAIRALAAEMGKPTVTMQCAANMQVDSLLGCWTSESGTLRFIDGPLTAALRTGAWLLAEEANVIHPGVWSTVNTLTDHTGEGLRLPIGEVVAPHADFRLILIYNEGYIGTREVNPALKDRLMPIFAGYLGRDEEIALLVNKTGATQGEAERVQSVAAMIRSANLRFDLSPRSLCRWIGVVKGAGMTWGEGYEKVIVDLVGTPELAAAQRGILQEIARNTIEQWPAEDSTATA